ncbi:hypothetical protein M3Y96_00904400 [Aphelenchoides besseyi]|nr:hypothetical protein M3Y96_00904400 [Aphelenchoides besseyi]
MSLRNIRRSRKKPKIEAPTNADLKRPDNSNSRCGPLQNAVVSVLKTNPPIKKPRESEKKHSKDDRHSSKRKTETERVEVKRESRRRIEYENNHRKSPEARKRRVDEREEKGVVKERKRDHRLKHERQVNSPSEVEDSPPRFRAVKKSDRKDTKRESPVLLPVPFFELDLHQLRPNESDPEIIKLSPDPPQKTVEEKEDTNSTTFIIRVGNKEIRRTVANNPPDPHGANDKNNANFVEKKRKRRADDPDEQQIDKVIAALDREQLTSQILPTAMLTRPTYYPVAVQQQSLESIIECDLSCSPDSSTTSTLK